LAFIAELVLATGGVIVAIRWSFFPDDLFASVDGLMEFADNLAPFVAGLLVFTATLLTSVAGFLAFVTSLLSPKPGVAASNAIPTAAAIPRIHSRFITD
jgi:hypothetical protein